MSDNRPVDRRSFFRDGLRELLKPLTKAAEPIERALREFESLAPRTPATSNQIRREHWIRPPGALLEADFLATCSRCAVCVSVCPANCIKIDTSGVRGNGAPYIVPSEMACVVCDGLHCMQNCPSGALVFTPAAEIDIGTAVWHEHLCVRPRGEDCTICVDHCPMGSAALTIESGRVKVNEEGCVGCGVCEQQCPTTPKSITVTPKSAR